MVIVSSEREKVLGVDLFLPHSMQGEGEVGSHLRICREKGTMFST